MEKKQTATQMLIENLKLTLSKALFNDVLVQDLFKEALEIEKEQNQLELPSDEEIYELAEKMLAVDYLSFTEGAKWMRDKIKGGNNE
jgi:hypothetical protein